MIAPERSRSIASMLATINLLAFVAFASALFAGAVGPVIPQIVHGLNVAPATAALLFRAR